MTGCRVGAVHTCVLVKKKKVHDTSGAAGTVNKSLQTLEMNETMLGLNTARSGSLFAQSVVLPRAAGIWELCALNSAHGHKQNARSR